MLSKGKAYAVQADDLAIGLFHFPQLLQEIPETGLGDNSVERENAHAVELRARLVLGRQVPADDLVFGETPW